MVEVIKRSGLLIPKKYYNDPFYTEVKEKLTRTSRAYQTSNIEIQTFYVESDKFLLVPRYFPLNDYTPIAKLKDISHDGEDIDIEHNITPRSETQKLAMEYMMNNSRGTIQLAPGVGKTVISIYVICERKKKAMILVHRDALADQWQDRFLQFTNCEKQNIARLTSAKFEGELQKPIIIGTVQTFISLLKRKREEFLTALNAANVGVFIGDEVHTTVGAPTFSECSIHIPSKVTFGLSATPYRYDGNGDIIEFHLGPIFEDSDTEGTMPAKITVLLMDYGIDTPRRNTYIRWGGQFQRARYLNLMKKAKPYREALRGLISKVGKDRNILCMVERVKLIDEHFEETQFRSKSKFCGSAKADTLEKRISFTTPGKCRDGIDVPWKDCVIMTSPIRNVDQLSGRVTRTAPNKQTPIIIDMVDYGCPDISRTYFSRRDFYNKKEWPIQYIFCKNNKMSIIDEQVALDIISGR
jgi:superfamily II DNA or RNA helicase